MTLETKRITSNFPSIFVDCDTCFRVLFSNYKQADHETRRQAEAVANHHNDAFQNKHHVVTVISESPKAE